MFHNLFKFIPDLWKWCVLLGVPSLPIWAYIYGWYEGMPAYEKIFWLFSALAMAIVLAICIIKMVGFLSNTFLRGKAVNRGVEIIFGHNDILSFREIAHAWSSNQNGGNGFSKNDIYNKLLGAFWMGDFEDKNGKPFLSVTYPRRASSHIIANPRFAYPQKSDGLNREAIFMACKIWDKDRMEQLEAAHRNGESLENLYEAMNRLSIEDYVDTMRTAYWEAMTISRCNFQSWLKKARITLPKDWY